MQSVEYAIPEKSQSEFPLDGLKAFVTADGLDDFIKVLEKDFYAEVKVQCHYHTSNGKTDLILNLYCNFGLTESLHHFNKGNWGGFSCDVEGEKRIPSFDAAFQKLSDDNNNSIDIAELSLHFRDTSIVVSRISEYSIPEQLAAIIFKTSAHFVYLTKGLTEMPYEIFVPVFEDHTRSVLALEKSKKGYFEYWGLYFDDDLQHDVIVYNLKQNNFVKKIFSYWIKLFLNLRLNLSTSRSF